MRKLLLPLAAMGLIAFVTPDTASATSWAGGYCSANQYLHCYATASWAMTSEEAPEGLFSEIITTKLSVPSHGPANFIDNEQWAENPAGGWDEAGVQTKEGHGEEVTAFTEAQIYPFVAAERPLAEFETEHFEHELNLNEWQAVRSEDINGLGEWCGTVYYGPGGEHGNTGAVCSGGGHQSEEEFAPYANKVSIGMEASAETAPEDQGYDETEVERSGWHHWNNAATVHNTKDYLGFDVSGYICAVTWESASEIVFGAPTSNC